MFRTLYDGVGLIDTSAAIALYDKTDKFHQVAKLFVETTDLRFAALNATSHETFTRYRYDSGIPKAMQCYDFLRSEKIIQLDFFLEDEIKARSLLQKYDDQVLSFHDALCAAIMIRNGIFKVFTFDKDFWLFNFEVMPGITY